MKLKEYFLKVGALTECVVAARDHYRASQYLVRERVERIAGVMSFGRSLMGSSEKLERQLELRAQSLSTEASRTADQGSMHAVHG